VLKLLKRTLLHGRDMPAAASLAYEQAMVSLVLDSDDAHEGCRAFLEKRKAACKGR
jgi:enoyl-CoA hydratase